jgi:hypothetical protein
VIFSQARQVSFSRTVWITFQDRGTTSNVLLLRAALRVRHILAELRELAATGRARARRRNDDALARQMSGQGCADRVTPGEAPDHTALGLGLGNRRLVFRRGRLELLELELQLVEELGPALGRWPEAVPLHLGNEELQVGDHGLGAGGPRRHLLASRTLGREGRLERVDVVGKGFGRGRHESD